MKYVRWLWVVPFVWLFGGTENRKRLRYIQQAHFWYKLQDGGRGFEYLKFSIELPEVGRHEQGECRNYSWCIKYRLDPHYEWKIPVPAYLTEEEVTLGWFMASAPIEQEKALAA